MRVGAYGNPLYPGPKPRPGGTNSSTDQVANVPYMVTC